MVFHNRALKIIKHKVIYDGIVNKLRKILAQLGLAIKFYYVFKRRLDGRRIKRFYFSGLAIMRQFASLLKICTALTVSTGAMKQH